MRKKLEGNGLWESSRMMLPEHVKALNKQREELNLRSRIELDVDEIEQVQRVLAESFQNRVQMKVKLYDKYEQLEVIGTVERIDQHKRRFMVDGEWFWLADIEGAAMMSIVE